MATDDSSSRMFSDSQIVLHVPAYVRKHRSKMFFQAPKRRRVGQSIATVAASVITHPDSISGAFRAIKIFQPRVERQMGVEFLLFRRGKPEWIDNGMEKLAGTRNLLTGHIDYDLAVVFQRLNMHLYVAISGDGNLDDFERAARSIVTSIRPSKGIAETPLKSNRSVSVGLNRADRSRLTAALEKLPLELRYLHKPILAIARQDQELLGSGEADTSMVDRALRKATKPTERKATALMHAKELHHWLDTLDDSLGPWAGPIGFVEGVLFGYAQFAVEEKE